MRLSRKDEHSIVAMLSLATHDRYADPVSLTDLSETLGISTSYLEYLFSGLRKHGLVEGLRGVGGGYRLARPAYQISIADILYATHALNEAMDEAVPDTDSLPGLEAMHGWQELNRRIRDFLADMTLADFVSANSGRSPRQAENSVSSYIASMFPAHSVRSGMSA
ncbi:MAG TPA: Rrf2 family transcriptional regulator [Candidatus Thiothrix moscowensis]|jgi:Rrf2 family iron-sulfur cluster assembly transcriptional regulator|uniref:Rrf2 family transcriptional regulator n=1 Tax=unclassified Thiothrix TaxID=2636184 RepID=UPI0025F8C2BD|nr:MULTISPECIES: Rrf2 family transcriptional regulator [unclassified Thiothrix]HRJ54599.1 Rrf2 family transcriptional regulator [Candidatus Thiothrix moscowensis]HRJ94973.1 Rrf2 family transcriptional regulator [Candidatus Thiothrix moscowensis]